MRLNPLRLLRREADQPVLLAITPPRTGERTLLGVENLLQSIAVPEPFALELAGHAGGVGLLARCAAQDVVRAQLGTHYPQARVRQLPAEGDPLRLGEGEAAWSIRLWSSGPAYAPLRTFRDRDLLDPGSDPLLALVGALGRVEAGERLVARLKLRALGPEWSRPYLARFHEPLEQAARRRPARTPQERPRPPGRDRVGGRPAGSGPGLQLGAGRRDRQGGRALRRRRRRADRRRLAQGALEPLSQAGARSAAGAREDRAGGVPGRDRGDGARAGRRRAGPGRGTARPRGGGLRPLRPARRRPLRGRTAAPDRPRAFSPGAAARAPLRRARRAQRARTGRALASAGRGGRGPRGRAFPAPRRCRLRRAGSTTGPTSVTPRANWPGRSTFRRISCAATISTWPAPGWASRP